MVIGIGLAAYGTYALLDEHFGWSGGESLRRDCASIIQRVDVERVPAEQGAAGFDSPSLACSSGQLLSHGTFPHVLVSLNYLVAPGQSRPIVLRSSHRGVH